MPLSNQARPLIGHMLFTVLLTLPVDLTLSASSTLALTSQCSDGWSQHSVDGQQGGVEWNGPQDEQGGAQGITRKDLPHTQRDITYYLDQRQNQLAQAQ